MSNTGRHRRLVWLPWHAGSPPLSAPARIELGCLLRRLQRGQSINLPSTCPLPEVGTRAYESRIHDRSTRWSITYRMDRDAIIIVEVLPSRPELQKYYFAVRRRLLNYEARVRHAEGSTSAAERGSSTTNDSAADCSAWRVGELAEFLQLTSDQIALVDIRLALADRLSRLRYAKRWTQADAARLLGSSQSRIAKMEVPESSVSVDLLVRSLLALGLSRAQLGNLIGGSAG
jgi:hypothetical protein